MREEITQEVLQKAINIAKEYLDMQNKYYIFSINAFSDDADVHISLDDYVSLFGNDYDKAEWRENISSYFVGKIVDGVNVFCIADKEKIFEHFGVKGEEANESV